MSSFAMFDLSFKSIFVLTFPRYIHVTNCSTYINRRLQFSTVHIEFCTNDIRLIRWVFTKCSSLTLQVLIFLRIVLINELENFLIRCSHSSTRRILVSKTFYVTLNKLHFKTTYIHYKNDSNKFLVTHE